MNSDWRDDALCAQVDTEIFFPEVGASTRAAKNICARCPVTEQCAQFAIDNEEEHGIWGGLSTHRRRDLRRAREVA